MVLKAAQSHSKLIDTPKLTTGIFIVLQREETQLYLQEHRHKFPQPRNLDKPLVQPHPLGADFTTNRNYKLPTQSQKSKQNEKEK